MNEDSEQNHADSNWSNCISLAHLLRFGWIWLWGKTKNAAEGT
jgi:hypothetical protein